jgi:hypothetical protein
MLAQPDVPELRALNAYLTLTLGSPRHARSWDYTRAVKFVESGAFDWLADELRSFGETRIETEPDSVAFAYVVAIAEDRRLVCYVAGAAPWAAVVAYVVPTRDASDPAGPGASSRWRYDGVLTSESVGHAGLPIALLLERIGLRLVSEAELRTSSPYADSSGAIDYWALLFEQDVDAPWASE